MPRRRIIQKPQAARDDQELSLCETLDRVLAKGVVAQGDVIISVAGVPLIQLGVSALLASVETIEQEQQMLREEIGS